jgi:hypothetical protein
MEQTIPSKALAILDWCGWSNATNEIYHPEYGPTNLMEVLFCACDWDALLYKKYLEVVKEYLNVDGYVGIAAWESKRGRNLEHIRQLLRDIDK